MPEILLSRQAISAHAALQQCQARGETLIDRLMQQPEMLRPYTPYLMSDQPSEQDWNIVNELIAGNAARDLSEMVASFGGDNVVALAILQERVQSFGQGLLGASASTYAGRVGQFEEALGSYQRALLDYRTTARSGSPLLYAKRMQARQAFDRLQVAFQSELKAITAGVRARRGTPLTNFERGMNIARDSRRADKLYVQTQAQARQLVRFTQHAKGLGNGLAVIDFGSRAGQVHTSYQAGGNWYRDLFIQSTGFTLGAAAGSLSLKGGLLLLTAFTPAGWVGLVVAGTAVAVGIAGSGMAMDHVVSSRAGGWYDAIMAWLN